MENRFYKVKLTNGRILGPIDLERIKLFVSNGTISGLEEAKIYPDGDWKGIAQFPEISDVLVQKLEGRLQVSAPSSPLLPIEEEGPESPTSTPVIQQKTVELPEQKSPPQFSTSDDDERTYLISEDEEKTMLVQKGSEQTGVKSTGSFAIVNLPKADASVDLDEKTYNDRKSLIAGEKTTLLTSPSARGKKKVFNFDVKTKRLLLVGTAFVLAAVILLMPEQKKGPSEVPFVVEMPVPKDSPDPQSGEKYYSAAIPFYNQDTVDGYKEAARLLVKSLVNDINNVKALCLLASSYLNLIDILNRDENYFNVITKLIELARAKNVDLAETVVADVELYNVLGNPEAAIQRIVEYTKSHPFGIEMFYYLSLSFYQKGDYENAAKYIHNIEPGQVFSPKITFLIGLLGERAGALDEAVVNYREVIKKSKNHIKARVRLGELLYRRDSLPEAQTNIDYVLEHPTLASTKELATSHYLKARILEVGSKDQEALESLQAALKLDPDNSDYWLEYYTVRARLGGSVKEAQEKAKMFHYLAQGEKALKENRLNDALSAFLSAREAQYEDSNPLIRIAEVFRKKGDFKAARDNLEKAIKISPRNAAVYPKYIKVLIDSYEVEDAARQIEVFKKLDPPASTVDVLNGDLNYKQDKHRAALAYYKRALTARTIDSAVYVAYANVMFKTGNYADAAFYYGLALRFDPLNTEATVGVGKSLAEVQGLDKGVSYVQGLLDRSPHRAALINGMAEICLQKGDYTCAAKNADQALTLEPTLALAHKTKGATLAALEKNKEALDSFKTYVTLAPAEPAGRLERYKIFMKKTDLRAAKDEITQLIEMYPRYPGAYYLLGEVYNTGQNYESALKAAEQEIKNNPGYLPAYALAGSLYNLAKDYKSALAHFNKALTMDPNYVPALMNGGYSNQMLKIYPAAQSMLERAVSMDQGNPQIHKRLGALYFEMGNRQKASQHFQSYLDLLPDAPDRDEIERFIR